jgi:hypothetical protein
MDVNTCSIAGRFAVVTGASGGIEWVIVLAREGAHQLIDSAVLIPTSARRKALCTAVALTVPNWRRFRAYGRAQSKIIRMFSPACSKQASL